MATLRRSYDRNLGYARFWGGVGIAIVSLLFTFVIDRIFEDSGSSGSPTEHLSEIAVWLTLSVLAIAALVCFVLGSIFWLLYRRDDLELIRIEQEKRES